MWRSIVSTLDVLASPAIERATVPSKGCHGILCKPNYDLPAGSVIAVIPFNYCLSPAIAIASPWGEKLQTGLSEYVIRSEHGQVEYSLPSALTTALTALSMGTPRSPLGPYLEHIELESEAVDSLHRKLGDAGLAKLRAIDSLNDTIMERISNDLCGVGLEISIAQLRRAHHICSSRCVDVPSSEPIFGGPALVPLLDLINHDPRPPNVVVRLEATPVVVEQCRRYGSFIYRKGINDRCPFYVVLRAGDDIREMEELHYNYVDPEEDPSLYGDLLYWASRFRFIPESSTPL